MEKERSWDFWAMSQAQIGKSLITTSLSLGFIQLAFLAGSAGQESFNNSKIAWYFGEVVRIEVRFCLKRSSLSNEDDVRIVVLEADDGCWGDPRTGNQDLHIATRVIN